MSFFNDFFNYFDVSDLKNEVSISMILGVGVAIVGNIKMINFSEDKIEFFANKKRLTLCGENMKIVVISKGEMIVSGMVCGLNMEN